MFDILLDVIIMNIINKKYYNRMYKLFLEFSFVCTVYATYHYKELK